MNKKTKLLSILGLVTAILFLFSSEVLAQSLSISGKVIDKNSQEPVIGASVLIEGTSNGTITDLDGNFMLSNVPSKGNLVVSYIGYATQTLPINGRTSFSVVLAEDTETLDEVVVIGYGVQKKVNLTGSVSSVKGDALERRPVADATQSLQGMVPGLLVSNSNTGRPGASGTLTLRGQGNLDNNANPYILVDGVEIISIVLKERTVSICSHQSIPMYMTPIAMIRNADILHQAFRCTAFFRRDSQCQRTVGCRNDTTVAISLFHIIVILFHIGLLTGKQFCIIFHRGQIGRT